MKASDSSNPTVSTTGQVGLTINPAAPTLTLGNPPPGVVGQPYTGTIPVTGGTGPYKCTLQSGAVPAGLTLNSNCSLTGTPTGGTASPIIGVFDSSNPPANGSGPVTITINPAPLTITTGTLPNGTVGVAYSATIGVTGGNAPYSCSLVTGILQAGLSLGANCVVSGTPTVSGTVSLGVKAADSSNPAVSTTGQVGLTIVAAPITLTPGNPPVATVGVPYTGIIPVSGGMGPYTCTLTSGNHSRRPCPQQLHPLGHSHRSRHQPGRNRCGRLQQPARKRLRSGNDHRQRCHADPYPGQSARGDGRNTLHRRHSGVGRCGSLHLQAQRRHGSRRADAYQLHAHGNTYDSRQPDPEHYGYRLQQPRRHHDRERDGDGQPDRAAYTYRFAAECSGGRALQPGAPRSRRHRTLHVRAYIRCTSGRSYALARGYHQRNSPPRSAPNSFTVTATDTEPTPQTASLPLVILVTYPVTATDGELKGPYAFLFQGYDDHLIGVLAYQTATVGSFTADGVGGISNGRTRCQSPDLQPHRRHGGQQPVPRHLHAGRRQPRLTYPDDLEPGRQHRADPPPTRLPSRPRSHPQPQPPRAR